LRCLPAASTKKVRNGGSAPQPCQINAGASIARSLCLALLLLAGCGGAEHEPLPCHGFGCGFDLIAPDGTRLRNAPGLLVLDQATFEAQVAEPFREVERCAQILTGGPLVIVVDLEVIMPELGRGYTYFHNDPLVTVTAQAILDGRVLRHEYVHYLLSVSGFPDAMNATHQSPLFLLCSALES